MADLLLGLGNETCLGMGVAERWMQGGTHRSTAQFPNSCPPVNEYLAQQPDQSM